MLTLERGASLSKFHRVGVIAYGEGEIETKYVATYDDEGNWENHGDFVFHPGLSDTVFVSADFLVPSSPITLVRPRDGWVYNKAMQEAFDAGENEGLELLLDNFDIKLSNASYEDKDGEKVVAIDSVFVTAVGVEYH